MNNTTRLVPGDIEHADRLIIASGKSPEDFSAVHRAALWRAVVRAARWYRQLAVSRATWVARENSLTKTMGAASHLHELLNDQYIRERLGLAFSIMPAETGLAPSYDQLLATLETLSTDLIPGILNPKTSRAADAWKGAHVNTPPESRDLVRRLVEIARDYVQLDDAFQRSKAGAGGAILDFLEGAIREINAAAAEEMSGDAIKAMSRETLAKYVGKTRARYKRVNKPRPESKRKGQTVRAPFIGPRDPRK